MNPFEFVLAIILISGVFSLLRHRMGVSDRRELRHRGAQQHAPEDSVENLRLRDEVKELKERLKVLERITVEKENTLSHQIEELRDR